MSRANVLRLPLDPVARAKVLVERSTPDERRPRLREEYERKLAEVEHKSAVCYAEAEELAHQLRCVTAEINEDEVTETHAPPRRGGEIRGVERR